MTMADPDWRTWLAQIGVAVPDAPDITAIVLACVIVAGAFWIGWFAGVRAGPPLTARIYAWAGRTEGVHAKRVGVLLHYAIVALLLSVAGSAAALSPLAQMILAFALGVAVAILAYTVARMARMGSATATILGTIALVASTAGTLGGLRPLILGLDGIGFTIGKTHLSLLGVVNFIVVAALLFVAARILNRVIVHSVGRMGRLDVSQRALVQKLGSIAVVTIAVLLGLDVLGIDLTALTVFSGAAGLAVGFGMQKTLGNLIAGLILLMDKSVKPGDVIVVGDTFGQIGKIGVRAVSVVTRDGKEHLIPNEQLMTDAVENWSYSSRNVRVHIPVGVSYDCDLKLAQRLMVEAASAAARVLPAPKPTVWLKDFGDSTVDHDILVWIADPEAGVGNVRSDILNRLWVLFKDNGVELPYPQRDVHVKGWPAAKTAMPPAQD
jgi:small-conductance mechanosensitive channel